jgi:ABC-type Fe3+-hydroxamate transport system substrate-binding protein
MPGSALKRPRHRSLPAVLAVLMILAAACGSEDDETSADAPASDEAADTTTTEAVEGDEETVNAITAIVDGNGETFNNNVDCKLGPDDSGSVKGTADDGSTLVATLDGTASTVVIDGPFGSFDAPFTSVSNDQVGMTITAAPPDIEVLVALSFCSES